jgi:excisionase family DNA binding protein
MTRRPTNGHMGQRTPTVHQAALERLALALAEAAAAVQVLAHAADDPAPVAQTSPALVSIVEAARLLGVSRSTVYTMVGDGRLPDRKVGRRHLVPTAALDAIAAVDAPDTP